jgi:hypothetical protein
MQIIEEDLPNDPDVRGDLRSSPVSEMLAYDILLREGEANLSGR